MSLGALRVLLSRLGLVQRGNLRLGLPKNRDFPLMESE